MCVEPHFGHATSQQWNKQLIQEHEIMKGFHNIKTKMGHFVGRLNLPKTPVVESKTPTRETKLHKP